jgi:hypothetical protein
MKGWTRGKKVAVGAGAGVLLLVPLVALCWTEILVQLEVRRLERQPGLLQEMLYRPRLPVEDRAIDAFLRKRAGKEALFREYERIVLERVFSNTRLGDLDLEETLLEALIWNTDSLAFYAEWYPPRQLCLPSIRLYAEEREVRVLNERMNRLGGEEFRSPRFPDLSFRFVPPGDALDACPRVTPEVRFAGRDEGAMITSGAVCWVCLARRDDGEIIRALTALLAESRNPNLMVQYLEALGELGPKARESLPAIRRLIEERRGEEWVWEAAESALRRIAGEG